VGDPEHEVRVIDIDGRYQAQCACGWHSILTPDRRVAEFHAGRHRDGNQR
jgi:hypothetical protein